MPALALPSRLELPLLPVAVGVAIRPVVEFVVERVVCFAGLAEVVGFAFEVSGSIMNPDEEREPLLTL